MNLKDIGTQLMYTTAPIYAILPNQSVSAGTAFVFSVNISEKASIPLLITNYHVVENAVCGYVEMHIEKNNQPTKDVAKVQFDSSVLLQNKLGETDLIALPLASALNDLQSKGTEIFYKSIPTEIIPQRSVINELSSIEEITFIGYPSAIYDTKNKIPIIRQGITATPIWNDFQGDKVFLIDAGVFPGSSGSPVFIYNRGTYPTKNGIAVGNRIMFVGVLTKSLQHKGEIGKAYLNLGIVINSTVFYDELNKYILRMTGKPITAQ